MRFTLLTGVSFAIAMSSLAGPLQAADGVLIVQKTTAGNTAQTNQFQIEPTRMRAEVAGRGDAKRVIIFDGAKQLVWMLDADKKTYNEMTKADIDRMGGQLQDAMAQVQAQLANMPPAQRAQIEAMMKGRGMPGAGGPPQKTEYRKTGTDKVGKWACQKYEGFENNQKVAEVCTAEPAVLGFAMADIDVARQLGEFFKKLMPQNAEQMANFGRAEEQGFSGVPIWRKSTVAGIETITEFTDVKRETFADASFALPAGFKKEDFPGSAGGGRGRQ